MAWACYARHFIWSGQKWIGLYKMLLVMVLKEGRGSPKSQESSQDYIKLSNEYKKGAMLQAELTSRRFDFIFQCGCLMLSTKLLGAMADHVETSLAGLTVKLVRRATSLAKIYFAAWNMTMWWCDSIERCPGHGFSWTASSRLWTVWAVFQLAYHLRWPARSLNSLFSFNWQPDLSYWFSEFNGFSLDDFMMLSFNMIWWFNASSI